MKKLLLPLLVALLGLGVGVGAGMALKPEDEVAAAETAVASCESEAPEKDEASPGPAAPECASEKADPFEKAAEEGEKIEGKAAYVAIEKPFVVPVFKGERIAAMVVMSLSIETGAEDQNAIRALEPRLRDGFLKAMFLHANSGGFDGSFTSGQKMQDLKSALRGAARAVATEAPVGDVLITEIARQDV